MYMGVSVIMTVINAINIDKVMVLSHLKHKALDPSKRKILQCKTDVGSCYSSGPQNQDTNMSLSVHLVFLFAGLALAVFATSLDETIVSHSPIC
jgi:hypothetical protein